MQIVQSASYICLHLHFQSLWDILRAFQLVSDTKVLQDLPGSISPFHLEDSFKVKTDEIEHLGYIFHQREVTEFSVQLI